MPRTLFTGWRTVTPGRCDDCGCDDDWQVDGRGNILCTCQACPDCNELDAYGMHDANCPTLRDCADCAVSLADRASLDLDGVSYCEDCYAERRDTYPCRTCGAPVDPSASHCTACAEDWAAITAAID